MTMTVTVEARVAQEVFMRRLKTKVNLSTFIDNTEALIFK